MAPKKKTNNNSWILHSSIRWDQTLCHKLAMRHDFFRILKGNVKLIHLCVRMGVYVSTGGGLGGITCVWVYCSVYGEVWGREKAVKRRKESNKGREYACETEKCESYATYHGCSHMSVCQLHGCCSKVRICSSPSMRNAFIFLWVLVEVFFPLNWPRSAMRPMKVQRFSWSIQGEVCRIFWLPAVQNGHNISVAGKVVDQYNWLIDYSARCWDFWLSFLAFSTCILRPSQSPRSHLFTFSSL